MPNHSTIPDILSVIYLGHSPNVPLIGLRSELSYGLEPHDHIWSMPRTAVRQYQSGGRAGVYPGWWGTGVDLEGAIPGTQPAVPGPIISHIPGLGPYLRPNEGNSMVSDEVSEIGSRNDPRIDQN